MESLNTNGFAEHIIRAYLGKYQNRFRVISDETGAKFGCIKDQICLMTDPNPLLAIKLFGPYIGLYEYIDIEEDDPFYGSFGHYQIEIITIPISDPTANKKIEIEVAKTLLAGTRHKNGDWIY